MTRLALLIFAPIFCAAVTSAIVKKQVADDLSLDWWQSAVFYQVYPRSFYDSDNDGNGDINGIRKKLDHFKDMGVDAIWLSPVYKSPQVDNGYDISDYRDIDPMYGSLDDLRRLIDEAHKINIKVIMDYVPNHTSDQHEWFQASLRRDPKYDDFYIWRNASYVNGTRVPPNNWKNFFKGSAWEWSEQRQQYYLHQFTMSQPDLNYRNQDVVDATKEVLLFWLNFGVDGFRMDAVMTLFEDVLLRDEPKSGAPGVEDDEYNALDHIYTLNEPESFDMVYQWRDLLDDFNLRNGSYTRIMMTEAYSDPEHTFLYYGTPDGSRLGAHFSFNFLTFILNIHLNFTAADLTDSIDIWWDNIPSIYTNNWVLGNHDQWRVANRLGVENVDALNMLMAVLPGVQVTYQGEEIGLENGQVTCEEGLDPQAIGNCTTYDLNSRDFERTPFQWDNTTNAGFNEGNKTWLPVGASYTVTNLAAQQLPDVNSHYNVYKESLKIRRYIPASVHDNMSYGHMDENIFFLDRTTVGARYVFYFNVGDEETKVSDPLCSDCLTVVVRSGNSDYTPGDKFNADVPLKPSEAIITQVQM